MQLPKACEAVCCKFFRLLQPLCKPIVGNKVLVQHNGAQVFKRSINTTQVTWQRLQKESTENEIDDESEIVAKDLEPIDSSLDIEEDASLLEHYINKAKHDLGSFEDIEYMDVFDPNKKLYYKMVDLWLKEAGETRRGHREFIVTVMHAMSRFNVESDISAYTKLLDCFPQGEHTGLKRDHWFLAAFKDKIADHLLGDKLIRLIAENGAIPNEELHNKTTDLFGKFSPTTFAARSILFWYGRLVSFNKYPMSVSDFKQLSPIEVAFYGLRQINPGLDGNYQCFPVDKTKCTEILDAGKIDSIISVQTPEQQTLLAKHDPMVPIFIEGPNLCYFREKTVQYYVMRTDPRNKEPDTASKSHILATKDWWTDFYKTDWKTDKKIQKDSGKLYSSEWLFPTIHLDKNLSSKSEIERDICQIEKDTEAVEGPVYAIACTDYNSPAALQGWIKGLVQTNKKLALCSVVFREEKSFMLNAPTTDPTEIDIHDPNFLEDAGFQ
uniref:Evolutionarily conserved signaling intermediate in Toll pathway, mitochondrial n=1 Tax=Phallusia mammillata TaxID=59560 RepID=A0A6F9DAZ6_9ASCI|nr:evolutionarily conserved signaling intermediate in Toll pathway, mitochondrial-like [Phallusia mammillata]